MTLKMRNNSTLSPELLETARRYIELEVMVKEAVTEACNPVCSVCSNCCCVVRFCRESVDSYWLRLIAALNGNTDGKFDGRSGWLTPQGCRLNIGRPPVCYEFFCDAITMRENNQYRSYALKVLGRLPGFVGRKALGGRHLVTLSQSELQNRFRVDRFRKRLASAEEIFIDCLELLRTGSGRRDRLNVVLPSPREIRK